MRNRIFILVFLLFLPSIAFGQGQRTSVIFNKSAAYYSIKTTGISTGQGGQWNLKETGSIAQPQIDFSRKGKYQFRVQAKADFLGNQAPQMQFLLDGRVLASFTVNNTNYQYFVYETTTIPSGKHTFQIFFTNLYRQVAKSRSLFLDNTDITYLFSSDERKTANFLNFPFSSTLATPDQLKNYNITFTGAGIGVSCGDRAVSSKEICDGNSQNCVTSNGYTGTQSCNAQCSGFAVCVSTESCGDGAINGQETCDSGSGNGQPNQCNASCTGTTAAVCGNTIIEAGEQCDDGNVATEKCPYGQASCSVCNGSCQSVSGAVSYCGDGLIQKDQGEDCDDGNLIQGDGCSAACDIETAPASSPSPSSSAAASPIIPSPENSTPCSQNCPSNPDIEQALTSSYFFDNSRSSLGMNLTQITDWEGMMPFIDVFKKAQEWTSFINESREGTLDLDQNGWVRSLQSGQTARTAVLTHNPPNDEPSAFPSGDYVVTYQGEGTIRFLGTAVTQVQNTSPGRSIVSINFAHPGAFLIQIDLTNPNNYLRDIRVYAPGGICNDDPFYHTNSREECESAGGRYSPYEEVAEQLIFYPPFLNNLKYYRVLRFMDTLDINGSMRSREDEMKTIDSATYYEQIPPEIVALLGNRLNVDVWINLPHLATDAFVERFATKIRDILSPRLKVYIEFSNEVGNPVDPYAIDGHDLAVIGCPLYSDLTGCDNDETPNNGILCEGYPVSFPNADCTTATARYYSDRAVEIMQIFERVFGGRDRLVRVMAGGPDDDYNQEILSHHNNYQHVDAFANSRYFGRYITANLNNSDIVESWLASGGQSYALEMIFKEILEGGALRPYYTSGGQYYDPARREGEIPPANGTLNTLADLTIRLVALAHSYGLPLIAYEGGQHLTPRVDETNTDIRDLMIAANHDSRMAEAYQRYLDGWKNSGADLLMLFVSHSVNSGFGLLNSEFQPYSQSPKLSTVLQFIDDNSCWWSACENTLPPVCGNGLVELLESCDDSNTTSGDGCSLMCRNE